MRTYFDNAKPLAFIIISIVIILENFMIFSCVYTTTAKIRRIIISIAHNFQYKFTTIAPHMSSMYMYMVERFFIFKITNNFILWRLYTRNGFIATTYLNKYTEP